MLNSHLKVRWIGPSLGHAFGTIGDDNKFKLWREDPSQTFQSGRRFRCVFSQSPSSHVSYVSLDFRTVKHEVWLVLMSRDGLLSLLEPSEESLHQWKEIDTIYPFGQHSRGSEPTFTLALHQAETPCLGAVSAGVDPKAISLCLSANTSIKILRGSRSDDGNYRLQEMLEVSTIASVINDVSWSPGSIRPHDLIAAACDDGCVRVYMLTTPYHSQSISQGIGPGRESPPRERHSSSLGTRQAPSGIGAGLAGVSRAEAIPRSSGALRIQHSWKEVAVLPQEAGAPVWRVRWTHDGKHGLNFFTIPRLLTVLQVVQLLQRATVRSYIYGNKILKVTSSSSPKQAQYGADESQAS